MKQVFFKNNEFQSPEAHNVVLGKLQFTFIITGLCFAGFYCEEGSIYPNAVNFSCPIGSYCPSGTSAPLTCPDGYHSNRTGFISTDVPEIQNEASKVRGTPPPLFCPYFSTN